MPKVPFLSWLIILVGLLLSATLRAGEAENCPICGMELAKDSKTSFESKRDKKPVTFCSFTCAVKFHKKNPKTELFAIDFLTGKRIDAQKAFFLIKSKALEKELPFGMPPTIVSFASEADAEKTKSRVKDGTIVKGFNAVEKIYE